MGDQQVHGWTFAAFLQEWQDWRVKTCLTPLRKLSRVRDAFVKRPLRLHGFGSKWQCRSCGMCGQNGRKMRFRIDGCQRGKHPFCSFMWTSKWISSHSKTHLSLMMDLIEEAEKWDLCQNQQVCGGLARMLTYKVWFEKTFKILGHILIRPRGRRTAWRKRCRLRKKPGGEVLRSTGARTSDAEQNAEAW